MATIDENTLLRDLDPDMSIGDLVDELKSQGLMKRSRFDRETDTFLGKIRATFKEIDDGIMHLAEPWARVDAAASKFAKTIGATKKGLEELRRSSIYQVDKENLGFNFNMSAEELIEAQQNYSKAIGRSMKLGRDDTATIAAITSIFGDQSDMYDAFDKMGVTMEGVGDHMGKMYHEAAKSGISLEKYAGNVKQGLAMANTYTFKDGIRGMEAMAKRAASIRMDMSQVSAFADRFSTVEDAITNSAKLQVLGGHFAKLADPINLLNMSLNSLEDTQQTLEKFTEGLATFDKATGEVKVSAFNRVRLNEFAKTTGQDPAKVMEVARRQAMKGEIEAQMNSARNVAGFDEDFKELIKNTATFKDGKAGVTINGDFKALTELTAKDQEKLIAETRTEGQDIKQIAKDVRSIADVRSGIKKQYENVQARTTARWAGNAAKWGAEVAAGPLAGLTKTVMYGLAFSKLFQVGGSVIRNIGNIWGRGGGGSTGSGAGQDIVKNIFKKNASKATGKAATEAAEAAAGKTAAKAVGKKAGSKIVKGGFERTMTRAGIKMGGKLGGKILGATAKGLAKGGPLGLIGAAGDIATDLLVDSGKMKKGGAAHGALKIGSKTAEFAALGTAIAPGIGTAIGALVGAAVGTNQFRKARKENIVDSQLNAVGIERKGKYSVTQLKNMDKALQTGEMSNSLRKKLLREGDTEIVNQINAVKKGKEEEKEEKREKLLGKNEEIEKRKFNTANFEIEKAFFPGFESPVSIIRGNKEDGNSKELNEFRRVRATRERFEEKTKTFEKVGPSKIDVNINGTLKLKGDKGQAVDVVAEIKRNPKLMQEIAEMVMKQMNTMQHGAYVDQKVNGATSAGSRV